MSLSLTYLNISPPPSLDNRCQNCWNELQIFHTFPYLASPLPRTMLCYCDIRLASRRIRSFSHVATSYLQNPTLFSGGGGGGFKSLKRLAQYQYYLSQWPAFKSQRCVVFQVILATIVAFWRVQSGDTSMKGFRLIKCQEILYT